MKITHKQKVKKAKKMLSNKERKDNIDIFQSKQWDAQKDSRHKKQLRIMNKK